jgi:putative ABC transport system substrate-binding protein
MGLRIAVLIATLASCAFAEAQQTAKLPRIGFLGATAASFIPGRTEALRAGLRELGYVEGKNIAFEYRWADGKLDRLPGLAAELVNLKVDVIVTGGPAATVPARAATRTIPIVMTFDHDPVGSGMVASLARPGGNITGLSILAPELTGKQLELLKEIVPGLVRVVVLGDSREPAYGQIRRMTDRAADSLRIQLQHQEVRRAEDFDAAFQSAKKEKASAVLVLNSPVFQIHIPLIARLAIENRLPALHSSPEGAEGGALMAHGPNITDSFRRAALYVDKILKGAKPSDLPVEQPTKFELLINLRTAKRIGLAIPPGVLARADKVIE